MQNWKPTELGWENEMKTSGPNQLQTLYFSSFSWLPMTMGHSSYNNREIVIDMNIKIIYVSQMKVSLMLGPL